MTTQKLAVVIAMLSALLGANAAHAATIAVFDAPAFVDTSGGATAESDTLQASLAALGHEVRTFTATRAQGISAALEGAAAVAFPELENADLASELGAAARSTLAAFVADGGGLIIAGTTDERAAALLNAIFGFALTSGVVGDSVITLFASGTGFEGAPSPLPDHLRTRGLDLVSLPDNALPIYVSGTRATVVRFPFGNGRVVYLGWDWYAAAPTGVRDGGWISTLETSVIEVTECALAAGGPDSDEDGIPDACDSDDGCADVDGNRTLGDGSRIVVKRELQSLTPNVLVVAADVFLPSGRPFAELDPLTRPFSLAVRADDGSLKVAETFPVTPFLGGDSAGWRYEPKPKEWIYTDRSGAVTNGFVSVVLKDMGASVAGRVRVEIFGRGGLYPLTDADRPLGLQLTVGDPAAGECGAITYEAEECRSASGGDRLTCKR
jgi:hypothetical protein